MSPRKLRKSLRREQGLPKGSPHRGTRSGSNDEGFVHMIAIGLVAAIVLVYMRSF